MQDVIGRIDVVVEADGVRRRVEQERQRERGVERHQVRTAPPPPDDGYDEGRCEKDREAVRHPLPGEATEVRKERSGQQQRGEEDLASDQPPGWSRSRRLHGNIVTAPAVRFRFSPSQNLSVRGRELA